MLLTMRMLEKRDLENLCRNIPSIASACVTWQNFPNANPLKVLDFFEVWELSVFSTVPWRSATHSNRWSNPSCPEPPKESGLWLSMLLVFQTIAFPKVGLYRQMWQCQTHPPSSSVLLACCTLMPSIGFLEGRQMSTCLSEMLQQMLDEAY